MIDAGSSRWVTALLLLLVAATAQLSEATYYGRYNRYGGRAVVVRTTVVRRGAGVWGRRLLQKEKDDGVDGDDDDTKPGKREEGKEREKSEKSEEKKEKDDDDCETILNIVESRPELSQLAAIIEDLPRIRAAMDQKNREDTFFAPTNDAIDSLLAWGGFVEKAKAGKLGVVVGGGVRRSFSWEQRM